MRLFFFFLKVFTFLCTFQLLESGAQPNYELERAYADHREPIGDFSRLSVPREYTVPDKSLLELFNPVVPHHQRPRS